MRDGKLHERVALVTGASSGIGHATVPALAAGGARPRVRRKVFQEVAMQSIIHNPTNGIYAETSDYVHGIEIRDPARWLYVAGTMGLRPDGSAPATLEEQLELIWHNIGVILAHAGMTFENIVRVTSYLRDASDAQLNGLRAVERRSARTCVWLPSRADHGHRRTDAFRRLAD